MLTFHLTPAGAYCDFPNVAMLACCYTGLTGIRVKNIFLYDIEDDNIESMRIKINKSLATSAIPGGGWSLFGTPEEINVQCQMDMAKLYFG